MLNPFEKAYCQALLALKHKDYASASDCFEKAVDGFRNDREFTLLRETTKMLVAVKQEIAAYENEDRLEIEEEFSNG